MNNVLKRFILILLLLQANFNNLALANDFPPLIAIGIEKGLSNNTVNCIFKDHKGFMWFGTHDGLNRYDGYGFKIFRNQIGNQNSLPHNYIYDIHEDQQENIWVATGQGIGIYNNLTTKFRPVFFIQSSSGRKKRLETSVNKLMCLSNGDMLLGTNGYGLLVHPKNSYTAFQIPIQKAGEPFTSYNLTGIEIDNKGRIWVFADPFGLCLYDIKTRTLKVVNHKLTAVFCMESDDNDNIWLGAVSGLYRYNISANQLVPASSFIKGKLTSDEVSSLLYDGKQQLWIGTLGGGVNVLKNLNDESKLSLTSSKEFMTESIFAIFQDNQQRKWMATSKEGILLIDPQKWGFKTIARDPLKAISLVSNSATCFEEDKNRRIWVGSDGDGLSIWHRKTGKFTNYQHDPGDVSSLSHNTVAAMKVDSRGSVWIATFGGGINKFKPESGTFEHFKCVNTADGSENKNVTYLFEDRSKVLWATTYANGKLYYLNHATNRFVVFDQKLNDLRCITETRDGVLWTGDARYLISVDKKNKNHAYYDMGKPVRAILEDKSGRFWIGLEGGGLILFNRKRNEIVRRYSTQQGLPNNSVLAIVEDNKGGLWLSTFDGLSRFDPVSRTFLNFSQEDGLQSNQFLGNAALKLKSGELMFGGHRGFNLFYPDRMRANRSVGPVILTGLTINNAPVSISGPYIRETKGDQIQSLQIPYEDAVITFDFAALEYTSPAKISYAYYLEGWDNGWNYTKKLRTAVYTKLNEGKYKLHIKTTNAAGDWVKNELVIHIKILPPWYRTWWAFACYGLCTLAAAYLYIKYYKLQAQLEYEVSIAELKVEKERELTENKLSFFTHVSHEFRTPLTLILNPVREFINSGNSQVDSKDLIIVYRNAKRLLSLVDQLLMFRKSDAEQFRITYFNLVTFCREIYECFSQQAKSRNVEFNFICEAEVLNIYADREKLEIVFFNLIANAFKFTPVSGKITFSISEHMDSVELHVTDSGEGISVAAGAKIFDRFYQHTGQTSVKGFGIGLFLVKKFVEGHKGSVEYVSEKDRGTDFKVLLYKGKDHLPGHFIYENAIIPSFAPALSDKSHEEPLAFSTDPSTDEGFSTDSLTTVTEKKVILVVEDDEDLRSYIKDIFSRQYLVFEASDGAEGYSKAKSIVPDIIISDVTMKMMSGVELCSKIKTNEELSHIPVILLTSSTSAEIKLKGIEEGADDFITKPFESTLLQARVLNLLKSKNTLQRYFFNEITLRSEDFKVSEEYKVFLEKCITITESHLDDPEFNVKVLAQALATTPSALYRKVKSISGKTTNEFIRYIRLRKAAQILVNQDLNINETAMMCGFNDIKYFREQFTKLFGMRPSEYVRKYRIHLSERHRLSEDITKNRLK